MRIGYFLVLMFLIGGAFGCERVVQSQNQTNQSTNQSNAVVKSNPLKLRLNNEAVGTTDNPSVLTKKLEEVFDGREENGVFRVGTNEVEKSVHLEGDRSVSAGEIAKLFGVLKSSKASPILIPVKIPFKGSFPRPNPLLLSVYAGSGESLFDSSDEPPEPAFNGPVDPPSVIGAIEIGFIGQLSENNNGFPPDPDAIAVVADKNGIYSLDGKQIPSSDLKKEIEKRLKTKAKDKKTIFVQAENYGNMQAVAQIAHSAGTVKLNFITKNNMYKENEISFSLSPAYFKDKDHEQIPEYPSVRFTGSDSTSFEITLSEELLDKEQAESEIKQDYEQRKKSYTEDELSLTEIDGSSGILTTIQNDEESYHVLWTGFRKKNGKQQLVRITFV